MNDFNENSNSLLDDVFDASSMTPKDQQAMMPTSLPPQEMSKADLLEFFKDILREKNISSNSSWNGTLKIVSNDPRFDRFRSHPERKQFFNAYKIQRAKEEKEEAKNKVRRSKEALATFLRKTDRMNSMIRYRHACELFRDQEYWKIVPEPERREIFEDAIAELTKKEHEQAKELRKRNMSVLSNILDSMTKITFRTTWQEAQQLLLDNPVFAEDNELLSMDKEDALIVFEKHIRQLEVDEDEEKNRTKKIQQRQQRLNRETFIQLLDELHASGKLNSLSKWCNLYADISSDARFESMLSQPTSGSTPLDLFKFYVEDLKARYEDEKIVIKDILKKQSFTMTPDTEFSEFVTILSKDPRSATLDSGNVKLMHEKLLDREREKYRERRREELKQRRKLEVHFLNLLERLSPPLNENSKWSDVRPLICDSEAFHMIKNEEDRVEIFENAVHSIVESCSHHHNHKSSHHRHSCRTNEKKKDKDRSKPNISKSKHSKNRHRSPSNDGSVMSHVSSIASDEEIDHISRSSSSSTSPSSSSSSSLCSPVSKKDRDLPPSNDINKNSRSHHRSESSHQAKSSRSFSYKNHRRTPTHSPTPSSSYRDKRHRNSLSRSPLGPMNHGIIGDEDHIRRSSSSRRYQQPQHSSRHREASRDVSPELTTNSGKSTKHRSSKYLPEDFDIDNVYRGHGGDNSKTSKTNNDNDHNNGIINEVKEAKRGAPVYEDGEDLEDLEKQRRLLLRQLQDSR